MNTNIKDTVTVSLLDMGMPLEMHVEGLSHILIGFAVDITGDDLIVKIRQSLCPEEFSQSLVQGTPVTIKYKQGEYVYRFESRLKSIIFEPTLLLLVEYSDSVKIEERRSKHRIKCKIPCELIVKENTLNACVQDISESGCRCSLFHSPMRDQWALNFLFEKNAPVNVLLPVAGTKKDQMVAGTMQFLTNSHDVCDLGIEFRVNSPEEKLLIETIVKRGW